MSLMIRCEKVCIAEGLFIPELTEARVPSLSRRNDATGDRADGNFREDSSTQSPSGVFFATDSVSSVGAPLHST